MTKKKKYVKRPFPRKGVDWDKIKREKKDAKNKSSVADRIEETI